MHEYRHAYVFMQSRVPLLGICQPLTLVVLVCRVCIYSIPCMYQYLCRPTHLTSSLSRCFVKSLGIVTPPSFRDIPVNQPDEKKK